jgi:hypothetical protein
MNLPISDILLVRGLFKVRILDSWQRILNLSSKNGTVIYIHFKVLDYAQEIILKIISERNNLK